MHDCCSKLSGIPFSRSAAESCIVLFGILDRLACAFDENGEMNTEGYRIHEGFLKVIDHFSQTSTDTEKQRIRRK